jgi:hypothetical protein
MLLYRKASSPEGYQGNLPYYKSSPLQARKGCFAIIHEDRKLVQCRRKLLMEMTIDFCA